jgi:hypothetical protein
MDNPTIRLFDGNLHKNVNSARIIMGCYCEGIAYAPAVLPRCGVGNSRYISYVFTFFFPSLAPKSLDGPISVVVLIYGDAASRLARHFRIDES